MIRPLIRILVGFLFFMGGFQNPNINQDIHCHLLGRYLDPKNIPKTQRTQEPFIATAHMKGCKLPPSQINSWTSPEMYKQPQVPRTTWRSTLRPGNAIIDEFLGQKIGQSFQIRKLRRTARFLAAKIYIFVTLGILNIYKQCMRFCRHRHAN